MKKTEFVYKLIPQNGPQLTLKIEIDENLKLIPEDKQAPDWTKLDHFQCANCPYNTTDIPHCPVAVNISQLVEHFSNVKSYEALEIEVTTKERIYSKKTDTQEGLFSILGLIMATSGCAHLDFLRPMAKYHLPFSSSEETIIRSVSLYLLGQYFNAKKGFEFDTTLEKLNKQYGEITHINKGILARIRSLTDSSGDADSNAITILQTLGQLLSMAIKKDLNNYAEIFKYSLK